jgi:hypothetical protein
MPYPGVDIDLRYQPWGLRANARYHPIGAHHNCWGALSELLPVREVFMMAIMNSLTDKPNWERKVFDEDIVARWRREALDMSEDALYETIVRDKRLPQEKEPEDESEHPNYSRDQLIKPRTKFVSEKAFDYVSDLIYLMSALMVFECEIMANSDAVYCRA